MPKKRCVDGFGDVLMDTGWAVALILYIIGAASVYSGNSGREKWYVAWLAALSWPLGLLVAVLAEGVSTPHDD